MKADHLFAEVQCPKCGYKNLIQFEEGNFCLRHDGDKFGTVPELQKIVVE
jgi:hypothetical protein